MQYRRPHRGFTPEAVDDIRRRYIDTDEPQQSIADDYSVHRKTIDQLARRENWPRRKERAPRDLPPDLQIELDAEKAVRAVASTTDTDKRLSMAQRLERAVEAQLAAFEQSQAMLGHEPPAPGDGERIARRIERLTAALYKIRHLRNPEAATSGLAEVDIPKDIEAFREALARRIEAFVRSRSDERVSGQGESGGTDSTR